MVARISATSRLGDVMKYNEKKVAQGKAVFLHAKNYLQDTPRLTGPEKMERFQRLHDLNPRSEVNTLHISLNFSTHDQLSREQLIAIADKYMEGLKMEKQPYLVYQHKDAQHPHLHIVTSLIEPDGKRIRTQNMGKELSEAARKSIEQEFNLTTAERQKDLGRQEQLTVGKIRTAVQKVSDEYRFSNLEEYIATLRTFRVAVGTGSEGSKTQKYGGLYYMALDEQGHKASPPIMASKLDKNATLPQVKQKFEGGRQRREQDLPSIRQRVDWALLQQPETIQDLTRELREQSIDLVLERKGLPAENHLIYVDHSTKSAVTAGTLGEAYNFDNLVKALAPKDQQALTQTPEQQQKQVPLQGLDLKGPQVLHHLMKNEGQFSPSAPLDEDENKRPRKRPRL